MDGRARAGPARSARAGTRRKLASRRLELYRRAARQLARSFGRIVIGEMDGAQASIVADNPLPLPARHLRTAAAPFELLAQIEWQARKSAVVFETPTAVDASRYCALHPHVDLYAGRDQGRLFLHCPQCEAAWDRDHNYALNLARIDSPGLFERLSQSSGARERSQIKIRNVTAELDALSLMQEREGARWKSKARLALAKRRESEANSSR